MSIKKLLYQYKFLKCELEEIIEERDNYTDQLSKKVYFPVEPKPAQLQYTEKKIDQKPNNLKKLYKELCKYYHPDKGGSEDLFNILQEDYQKNNFIGLLSLAIELNLNILSYIDDNSIEEIKNYIQDIEQKIQFIKKTAPYVWGHLKEDKKPDFENWLIENHNFKKREI